jgi:hypothetical protein
MPPGRVLSVVLFEGTAGGYHRSLTVAIGVAGTKEHLMGYGIGGILILILVILAIIYLAKRV